MKAAILTFLSLAITITAAFLAPPSFDTSHHPNVLAPLVLGHLDDTGQNLEGPVERFDEESFLEFIRTKKNFVDKSLFIKEFVEHPLEEENVYLTAPRGFGKTTNLIMIRDFFQIPYDNVNGEIIDRKETDMYKYFSGEYLVHRKPLNISFERKFVEQHCGMYPVVHLQLKDMDVTNRTTFYNSASEIVRQLYLKHQYLLKSTYLSSFDKLRVQNFMTQNFSDFRGLYHVGYDITKFLFKHFHRNCIVVIDDFDKPLTEIVTGNTPKPDSFDIIYFMNIFFGIMIRENEYVEKALFTGNSLFPMALSRNMDSVRTHKFDELPWAKYYGFTESDILSIANPRNIKFIVSRFDGYDVPDDRASVLLNPYSVTEYISSGKKHAWSDVDAGKISSFKSVFLHNLIRKKIYALLEDAEIYVPFRSSIDPRDINSLQSLHSLGSHPKFQGIQKFSNNSQPISRTNSYALYDALVSVGLPSTSIHLFFQHLTEHGYLTRIAKSRVKIPNLEVKDQFEKIFRTAVTSYLFEAEPESEFEATAEAMLNINESEDSLDAFTLNLQNLLQLCKYPHRLEKEMVSLLMVSACERLQPKFSYFGREIRNSKRVDFLAVTADKKKIYMFEFTLGDERSPDAALKQFTAAKNHADILTEGSSSLINTNVTFILAGIRCTKGQPIYCEGSYEFGKVYSACELETTL